jgi:hypothetical protein
MKNHKHYKIAVSAHYGTSMSPERRAESECKSFDEEMLEVTNKCGEATALKYEKLWLNHMSAKSKCFSVMITGAGNFPVKRHAKANESERRHGDIRIAFYNKVMADKVESNIIKSNDENVIEKLQEKLDGLLFQQVQYKEINKIMRNKKLSDIQKVECMQLINVHTNIIKDALIDGGIQSFMLTSINTKIKATKQRIDSINKAKSAITIEKEFRGFRMVENSNAMRIQLHFDDKPSDEIRQTLKSNSYKWYAKEGVWQRQLTANAKYNFNQIKNKLES